MAYSIQEENTLTTCTNKNCEGCVDDRKITIRGTFFMGIIMVSLLRKKQNSIFLSTMEVEYIAVVARCTHVIWMEQPMKDTILEYDQPILIFIDNTSVINISNNHVMDSKIKHIPIKYHFLREKVVK